MKQMSVQPVHRLGACDASENRPSNPRRPVIPRTPRNSRNRKIAERITTWFHATARDLPWRSNRTPYRALVAELMLQQTQVSRVLERYDAFLTRFPTVERLAASPEQRVLASWQGLGYYRRARYLHAAAKQIVADHGGVVPRDVRVLRSLPGIGRYTAGAIASIAFGERAPIVDGNVARVLARLHAVAADPQNRETVNWMWQASTQLVEAAADPAALNEGLMELGATVCTPHSPNCAQCPLRRFCAARRLGVQNEIPPPKTPAAQKNVHHYAVIIRRADGRILIEKRPSTGLWSNMWQVPTLESEVGMTATAVRERLSSAIANDLELAGSFPYQTTHRQITFTVYRAEPSAMSSHGLWRMPNHINGLPMSNAQRRILSKYAL